MEENNVNKTDTKKLLYPINKGTSRLLFSFFYCTFLKKGVLYD
jgi:hypothetical protein